MLGDDNLKMYINVHWATYVMDRGSSVIESAVVYLDFFCLYVSICYFWTINMNIKRICCNSFFGFYKLF